VDGATTTVIESNLSMSDRFSIEPNRPNPDLPGTPLAGVPQTVPVDTPGSPLRVRHPGDVLRVTVGVLIVTVGAALIRIAMLTEFETNLFRLINRLPQPAADVLAIVQLLGNIVVALVVGLIVLAVTRRWRLSLLTVTSGGAAWLVAKIVKVAVGRGRPADLLTGVIGHGTLATGLGYPSGHSAVAAALATVLSPYLPKAWRRVAWSIVWMVAFGRVAVGAHLPADIVGGVALGWVVGSIGHLVVGSPQPKVPFDGMQRSLALIGVQPTAWHLLSVDARSSIPLRIETTNGNYFAKVLLALHRDADWLFKVWRRATLRHGVEDETPFLSIKHQVEHEAYVSLLARRAGVNAPDILAAGTIGPHASFLLTEWVDGAPLASTGELPPDLWRTIGRMHDARIAHRDLRSANVLVSDGSATVLDFGFAETFASDDRIAMDVAELLVSSALLVGAENAIRHARPHLPEQRLAAAARYLQPLALASATRAALHEQPDLLGELRSHLGGDDPVPLAPMARIRLRVIVYLIAMGIAVHALLPQLGELRSSLSALATADYWMLGAALIASGTTYIATAWGLAAAVDTPLRLGELTRVQLANQFLNIFAPGGLAGFSASARYLMRCGVGRETAIAAVGAHMVAGVVTHFVLLAATVVWVGSIAGSLPALPSTWAIVLVVTVVALLIGIAVFAPSRHRIFDSFLQGLRSLRSVVRQPRRAATLFAGTLTVNLAYIAALFLALRAVGAPASVAQATAAYLIGAIVGSVTPTPGGLGGTEAALVAALTGLGLPVPGAVAGVLAFRAATFWVPLIPGAVTARQLHSRHAL
jgi:undecaprenyl-diphosphatase